MLRKTQVISLAVVLLLLIFNLRTFHYMVIFWSFFAGGGLCMLYIRPGYHFPNFFLTFLRKNIVVEDNNNSDCSVCGVPNCKREKRQLNVERLRPWVGIEVNGRVNAAVEEFIEIVIERHVDDWYSEISTNEHFKNELRLMIRHVLSVFYRRINKLDLPEVIIQKLIKVSIIHLHICLSARNKGFTTEDDILIFYGSKLHVAMKNRRRELNYIRNLSEKLFPLLLPEDLINSRLVVTILREILAANVFLPALDAIANPDHLNQLLLLFFDRTPAREAEFPPEPLEELLINYKEKVKKDGTVLPALRVDLPDILKQQDMLYQFMSFLKAQESVHILQFCLTVEDFNRRCLAQQKDEMQSEFREIFKMYFTRSSSNYIHFEQEITDELTRIINEPWSADCRLRMSGPMFSAYEQAYNLLEHVYCPLFYHSDIYYKMICGDKMPVTFKKLLKRNEYKSSKLSPSSSRKFSQKMKDVFRSSTSLDMLEVESTNGTSDYMSIDGDDDDDDERLLVDLNESDQMDSHIHRDLSSWRVTIPHVEEIDDDGDKYAFGIQINKVSIRHGEEEPESWWAVRRYTEFYVLESKLTEFHGSLSPAHLPPKKLFSRSYQYLKDKIPEFERFIKLLISKPVLRRSQLLYDFLRPKSHKNSQFNNKLLPDVKLGRFFKQVPNKIIKEKGQHLEIFFQALVQSCEQSKPKPGKTSDVVESENPSVKMDEKLQSDLYPDSDWQFDSYTLSSPATDHTSFPLNGVADYLLYLAHRVFKVPHWCLQVMSAAKIVTKNTIEPFLHRYLLRKINQYRAEHHVVYLINLLKDILFFNNDPPRTKSDKLKRKQETVKELELFLPGVLPEIIGQEHFREVCESFVELLQMSKLNKQLSYMLLETFLLELFPEFNETSS